jgi:hypothetical protein
LGCHTLGSLERCRGERNENLEEPRVYFGVIRLNEQNLETFSDYEEMKFSAIFQSGGEVEFELKNSIVLILFHIIASRPFKTDFGISGSYVSQSLASITTVITRFR